MRIERCCMCFQPKNPLVEVVKGMPALVCKACGFKIVSVMGFLEYHGAVIAYQRELFDTPPAPPQTPEKPPKTPKATTK